MKKEIKVVVIEPEGYNSIERFPLVYLLHGFSGNYKDVTKNVLAIEELAD
ncbi:alpha/beta hydrolase-fold protein [Pedobacter arcticus]|nr:alpha/beta hydrolase-fold protein [Pedobacter arcticus]